MRSDKLQEALMLALQNKLIENKEIKKEGLYDSCYRTSDRDELKQIALNAIYVANDDEAIRKEMNENKSIKTKTEARRNPLAKVGDTDNRSYGRDLKYPDEIYALQSIWGKLLMDIYGQGSSDATGLGDLINEYENGELTISQIESELPVVYDLLDANIDLSEEDVENSTLSSAISYKDIRDICQEVLNDQLANANMPFTVTLDDYGDMDFYIDNIKYNGQNEGVKKFVGVFNRLGDDEKYEMLTSYEDNKILNDRFRSLQKRTQTDLNRNDIKHLDINYDTRYIKKYEDEIANIKSKLGGVKNYNKAKQLQKDLDTAEYWLQHYKDDRQEKIDSILARINREIDKTN